MLHFKHNVGETNELHWWNSAKEIVGIDIILPLCIEIAVINIHIVAITITIDKQTFPAFVECYNLVWASSKLPYICQTQVTSINYNQKCITAAVWKGGAAAVTSLGSQAGSQVSP